MTNSKFHKTVGSLLTLVDTLKIVAAPEMNVDDFYFNRAPQRTNKGLQCGNARHLDYS